MSINISTQSIGISPSPFGALRLNLASNRHHPSYQDHIVGLFEWMGDEDELFLLDIEAMPIGWMENVNGTLVHLLAIFFAPRCARNFETRSKTLH